MRVSAASVTSVLVLGASASAVAAYVTLVLPKGELGQKKGFAALQGIELTHRHDADVRYPDVLFSPNGLPYVVLGVPTHDESSPRAWIILNETTPISSVYVLPQNQRYFLSCSYLTELSSKTQIVPEVLKFLRRNCTS